MERGDLGTFEVVQEDVLKGAALLWIVAIDDRLVGAAVTQIQETEKSKACVLLAVGGERWGEWRDLLSLIENYARMFGCNKVRFAGRKGWARLMKGYTVEKIVMERRL